MIINRKLNNLLSYIKLFMLSFYTLLSFYEVSYQDYSDKFLFFKYTMITIALFAIMAQLSYIGETNDFSSFTCTGITTMICTVIPLVILIQPLYDPNTDQSQLICDINNLDFCIDLVLGMFILFYDCLLAILFVLEFLVYLCSIII